MPFSLTQEKFNTWIHVREPNDLNFADAHLELGPFYFLHHQKNTLDVSPNTLQAFLNQTGEPLSLEGVPEDFIWKCSMGPIRLNELRKPHQIRVVFSNQEQRALKRIIQGSDFSDFLWRIIPTDPETLMPYSKKTEEFLFLHSLLLNTQIIVQGLEDSLNAEDIGQEIKIDKKEGLPVTVWKDI